MERGTGTMEHGTETMERGPWGRVGPAAGVLAAVAFVAATITFPLARDLGVRPEDPAEDIARAMSGQLAGGAGAAGPWLMMLAVFLLLWFVGDLHQRLRAGVDPAARWLATVFLGGGLALVAGLLFFGFVWAVQVTIVDFGEDVQVARALFALGWLGLLVVIPGAAAMTGAAAVASLRFAALPRWLGVVGALAAVVAFTAYWVPVWLVWVLLTSVTLLARREQVEAPEHART